MAKSTYGVRSPPHVQEGPQIYRPIRPRAGRLPRQALGLHLERDGRTLRRFDPASGAWLPTPRERAHAAEAALRQAEEARQQSEAALHQAQAELERLRREIEQLRHRPADEP
jgi:hypothetical protein